MTNPIDLFEICDHWGAAEWFDRMAKAIREHDKAVAAGLYVRAETYRNIAASSGLNLVRDYEQQIRAALKPVGQPTPVIIVGDGIDGWRYAGPGDVAVVAHNDTIRVFVEYFDAVEAFNGDGDFDKKVERVNAAKKAAQALRALLKEGEAQNG
ncbi:hypothetical protein [Phyllobacterium chamaecytisi]|uniref:hypothetical protein n=1 Tax=Phyllobacterium chamaecytisi TaxID=2876082 RepID=UPI001CC9DE0E|nr:hypothetical protein [Phyllobacterium sp. KW56]MBZ9600685.1 hypothetical protein [Phyllobacterium sp. KW56]